MSAAVLDATEADAFPAFDDLEPEAPKARRTRAPRDPNAPVRTRQTSDAKLAKDLLEPMAMLGQAVSFMSPTGGAVIIARGEATTSALVQFAKGHPKMLAALRNISKVSPAAEIIQTLAMVLIAVQIDLGALQPTAPFAVLTGVAQIHSEMQEFMATQDTPDIPRVGGQYENIAPPEFLADGYKEDGTWAGPPGVRAGPGAAVRNP